MRTARWPPVYDADDLKRTIGELVAAGVPSEKFFTLTVPDDPPVCQGDVVALAAGVFPFIDETGQATAADAPTCWLVIGNTCDFERDVTDVPYTQVVPLIEVGGPEFEGTSDHASLKQYSHVRRFYVPPWPGTDLHHVADFTRLVAAHKGMFPAVARVVARMEYAAWVLLHACLIRFLCRDDGRFD